MRTKGLPRRFVRLSLAIWVPVFVLALILLYPQMAKAGGPVTDCSDDADLHAKLAGGGLVTFDCGSTPITITLTITDTLDSYINITQTTTISGGGLITLQGNGTARIFNVDGSALSLEGLTITGGRALSEPNHLGGAAIITGTGVVTVTDSTLFDNQAQFGGAFYVQDGTLTVVDSSLLENQAVVGGAIYVADTEPANPPTTTVTILNSSVLSNRATDGDGGAIRNYDARLTVANSTLSNNRAIEIAEQGFNGGDGGAIAASGVGMVSYLALLTNTTIYSNFASLNGGGIQVDSGTGSGWIKNSIIANNTASTGTNCSSIDLVSHGNNLESEDTCNLVASGDLTDTNPLLGPLADNGGGTLTYALLAGSPAINAADNTACAASPVNNVDQRGISRPQGATCDIGAFEATASLSLTKISINEGGDPLRPTERLTYTIGLTNSGALTVTNALISDTLPAHTSFVTDSIRLSPSGAGTAGTELPTLASDLVITPGQSISVTFAVSVDSPLADQTLITNTASVTSSETPGALSDTVTDTVSSEPSLAIHKSSQDANGGDLVPGDVLSYTIVVANSGAADATSGVISDTLPAHTSFVTDSIRLSPSDAGTAGTELPTLANDLTITAGQSISVTFAVSVDSPLPDQTLITNTASVASNEVPAPIMSNMIVDTVRGSTSIYLPFIMKDFEP
jgi:uncharacterized repeat protein (TIGR01451 family)